MGCQKQQVFIDKVKQRFGNAFTFEKLVYRNKRTPIVLTCKKHGDQLTTPQTILSPGCKGCVYCSNTRLHPDDFLERAIAYHGDKYEYHMDTFTGGANKIRVTCPSHGDFYPIASQHIGYRKTECSTCAMLKTRVPWGQFLKEATRIHNGEYTYVEKSYTKISEDVTAICPEHGKFTVRAYGHLDGYKCKKCADLKQSKGLEQFILEARAIFGDEYDYSEVVYTHQRKKVKIICPKHGAFMKDPFSHIHTKGGCQKCKESIGEREVRLYLERRGLEYVQEYKMPLLKYRWDFLIPEHLIFIEFHGIQHYKPVERFGGTKGFEATKRRDKEKLTISKLSGYRQIDVSCMDKRSVKEILDEALKDLPTDIPVGKT